MTRSEGLAPPSDFPLPLIGFAAFSGTGKTTLILELLPLIRQAGLRVAVIKHAHHSFDMDYPGKDSYRLRMAGADEMVVAARHRMGWIRECREARDEPSLAEALAVLDTARLDLVLVEGFKHEVFPKIELHRGALGRPLMFPNDPNIIALATDGAKLAADPGGLPLLSIDRPAEIAAFVFDFIGRETSGQSDLAC